MFNIIKNKIGKLINPATEETLANIKSQTDLFSFDSSSNPANLKVNVSAGVLGVKNSGGIQIDPATEATLAAINAKISSFTFDSTSGLVTSGLAPTLNTAGVLVKDTTTATLSPATDEAAYLWMRMAKMMESKATADANKLKRVTVDSFGTGNVTGIGGSTGVGVSGSVVPLVTIANDFSANLTGLFTSTSFVGYNNQMFQDPARTAYSQNIRSKLFFS